MLVVIGSELNLQPLSLHRLPVSAFVTDWEEAEP